MSVRHFGPPGQWITNYSGIAYSDDGGQTWIEVPTVCRPNTPGFDEKFQMIAYARMMYLDQPRGAIMVRFAPQPTGPWGAPTPVATSSQYPSLYGGFLNPDSHGSDIYFTMTQYDRYTVSLMHTTLPTNATNSTQTP